jgi:glycosyltransferase involved in cell wall biosynthesis
MLFNIIRQHLPKSLYHTTEYFTYKGSSLTARVYDVLAVVFRKGRHIIHHVIGDFNYATYFMPKCRTVLTIHDLYRIYLNQETPLKLYIVKLFWLKIPIVKSAIVTVVSQYTKDEILKYVSCDPDKIRVIYNCISPDFKPVPKIFNKQKPVLLQLGTRPNKNIDRLVHAIAGLNCKLEIVGKPKQETIKLMESYHIDYSWSGHLSQDEVIQKYIDCDILVFASTYEGFGMPIIEANAVGRAVITGNVSAMPEIAADAACLVDPMNIESIREGINRVIYDDEYRATIIKAGQINRSRFLPKAIASKYVDLYNEFYSNGCL